LANFIKKILKFVKLRLARQLGAQGARPHPRNSHSLGYVLTTVAPKLCVGFVLLTVA